MDRNDPATMERLDWQTSIKKGVQLAKAISRSSWALGDLALKLFPPSEGTTKSPQVEIAGEIRTLTDFADAIDVSPKVLGHMRSVSLAWPPAKRRPNVAWSTHRALATHPDRFKLIHDGMKRGEASDLVDKLRQAQASVTPVTASAPAERAVAEARAALALAGDKRRKINEETRDALLLAATELREIADRLVAVLVPKPEAASVPQPEPEAEPAESSSTTSRRRRIFTFA